MVATVLGVVAEGRSSVAQPAPIDDPEAAEGRTLLIDREALPESAQDAVPLTVEPDFDDTELTSFVERFLERARTPSAAVAIVHRDRVVYARGFGESAGTPVTADDRFYIGSCTKLFTALAVMQLVDTGFLELDTPVQHYLPDFGLEDPVRSAAVTVRQLLSHTSGLSTRSAFDRTAQLEGRLGHLSFADEPGAAVHYSSLNYLVLGQLVEAVSGMPYAEYLRTFVTTPLDLDSTYAERQPAEEATGPGRLVQGHAYFLGAPIARAEPPYTDLMVPVGYVVSSARDLGRFLAVFANRGWVEDRLLLSPGAVDAMLTPGERGTGLGFGGGELHGHPAPGHAGMTPGFSARLTVLPDLEYGIAIVASRNDGPFFPAYRDLMDGIVRRLVGAPTVEYPMKGHWLRLGFVAALLWTLFSLATALRRWRRAGRPLRAVVDRSYFRTVWLPGLVRLALSAVLFLWVLRSLAKISLAGMLEFYPDLGLLLVLGLVVAAVEAAAGILVRSKEALSA